jgi:hypothetical protein
MEQFPKIAKVRMTAQATGEHPEAEQLNAFAENALASGERESVTTHLATCASCREIVSLAVEARPEGSVSVKPARDGFRWATFQWAAVAASVAIVTVAVLVVGPKETKAPQRAPESVAMQRQQPAESPAVPSAPQTANLDSKASRAAEPKSDAHAKSREPGKTATARAATGPYIADGVAITDGGFGGIGVYGRGKDLKSASTDTSANLAEKKEVGSAQPAGKTAPARELAYSAPGSQDADTFTSSVRRAPAPSQPAQGALQGGTAQNAPPPASVVDGERGRAEIQTKGSNEISKDKRADAGAAASTESVQVAANAASVQVYSRQVSKKADSKKPAGAASGGMIATSFDASNIRTWRLQSGRIQSSDDGGKAWQDHTPAANLQPTIVAAVGQQVWVGGKSGALFISRDYGQNWTKTSLTGDDVIPLGDVSEIKIKNPQLVDVILNGGDDWQTIDGGKSFRLLPRKP